MVADLPGLRVHQPGAVYDSECEGVTGKIQAWNEASIGLCSGCDVGFLNDGIFDSSILLPLRASDFRQCTNIWLYWFVDPSLIYKQ